MNNLRKQILKEIKTLLNERIVNGETYATLFKSAPDTLTRIKQLGTMLDEEAAALKAAGKDTTELEAFIKNVKSTDPNAPFDVNKGLDILADARRIANQSKTVSGEAGAVAGTEAKAVSGEGTAATANEVKQAEQQLAATPEPTDVAQGKAIADNIKTKKTIGEKAKAGVEFVTQLGRKCWGTKYKWCMAALVAGGIGTYAAYKILEGAGAQPSPDFVPPPDPNVPAPTPPPEQTGEFGKRGRSFKCSGDTPKNSIVAKYQRYVGVFPDGSFGERTYNAGQKKDDAKLPSPWKQYANNVEAGKICAWLKDPNHPWAKLDGTQKKGGGGKGKGAAGGGTGSQIEVTLFGWQDYDAAKRAAARIAVELDKLPNRGYIKKPDGSVTLPAITINTDPVGIEKKDTLRLYLQQAMKREGYGDDGSQLPVFKFVQSYTEDQSAEGREGQKPEEETPDALQESWHRKHQTSYSNNLFERLVKSVNNKKVM